MPKQAKLGQDQNYRNLRRVEPPGSNYHQPSAGVNSPHYGACGPAKKMKILPPAAFGPTRSMGDCTTTTTTDEWRRLRVMSWNIEAPASSDPAPAAPWEKRLDAVCSEILESKPDVVLLQEVVEVSSLRLRCSLAGAYELIVPSPAQYAPCDYFVGILLRCDTVAKHQRKVLYERFVGSQQGRGVLELHVEWRGRSLALLCSHLESCVTAPQQIEERKQQFAQLLNRMLQLKQDLIVFGADTNLRSKEEKDVRKENSKFIEIVDAFEVAGKPKKEFATWDQLRNLNVKAHVASFPGPPRNFVCRLRFDRIFYRAAMKDDVRLQAFELGGRSPVPELPSVHPSDHFCVRADFRLAPTVNTRVARSAEDFSKGERKRAGDDIQDERSPKQNSRASSNDVIIIDDANTSSAHVLTPREVCRRAWANKFKN